MTGTPNFEVPIVNIENLHNELHSLKKENEYLKKLLAAMMNNRKSSSNVHVKNSLLTNRSLPQEKIKLIQSLFKGRTDAFAKKWMSQDGKKGYTTACDLEWQKPICKKPEIKCIQCQHRQLSPLTDQVLFNHLKGDISIGIYPMYQDETCSFLALDFDKQNWQKDVLAFAEICKAYRIPIHIERSQSGNCAHVWMFFNENIPAKLARKLGTILLSKTLEKRNEVGLDSFDRMIPNQDTLPKGGFGNLIALPLHLHAKKQGNSVFVDESFTPYPDQWMYLSSVEKISKRDIERVMMDSKSQPQVIETTDNNPIDINVTLKNGIYINKEEIPPFLYAKIMNLATFNNPEYYKAQKKRMSTYGISRLISCYDENENHIIFPRGCFESLQKLASEQAIKINMKDNTYEGKNFEVSFNGQLTSQQVDAVSELFNHSNGIISATTGFGKTVTAAALIARRKTNTLIIVDRKQLLHQWIERLSAFLNVPPSEIGQIGGGKSKITGKIDVATMQSL